MLSIAPASPVIYPVKFQSFRAISNNSLLAHAGTPLILKKIEVDQSLFTVSTFTLHRYITFQV